MKAKSNVPFATYVFGLLRAKKAPASTRLPEPLPGMEKTRILDAGKNLYLIVASAPMDRYDEASIHRGLQDLDWVSECALAHERVVEHFAKSTALIPLKLFTIFLDDTRAVQFVERSRRALNQTLDRIEGCREYGVRIGFDEAAAAMKAKAQLGSSRPVGGADFLRAKKQLRDAVKDLSTKPHPHVDEAHEALSAAGKESRTRPITASSGGKRLLLDGAYLVPVEEEQAFKDQVETLKQKLEREGYEVTFTGPWPPYNFIQEEG